VERDHQYRTIAGIRTSLYDSGPRDDTAPTIVMVHGGDPRSLSNALDWSTIWDPAGLGSRLVAYDKPGQGYTFSPDLDESVATAESLSTHLAALIESLGREVVLMGHSRGALPVATVALRRPELVRALVLVASNTLASSSDLTPRDFYPTAYADPPVEPSDEYVRREPEMNSFSSAHIDARFIEGRRRPAVSTGWWDARDRRQRWFDGLVSSSLQTMRESVLAGIRERGFGMPVLQIWGQNDVSAPVELAHDLFASIARRTADATSVVINESAHYVYREHPQRFAELLRSFAATTS
jgi:pimeloyl-ACP methyl ester carboxylesterase